MSGDFQIGIIEAKNTEEDYLVTCNIDLPNLKHLTLDFTVHTTHRNHILQINSPFIESIKCSSILHSLIVPYNENLTDLAISCVLLDKPFTNIQHLTIYLYETIELKQLYKDLPRDNTRHDSLSNYLPSITQQCKVTFTSLKYTPSFKYSANLFNDFVQHPLIHQIEFNDVNINGTFNKTSHPIDLLSFFGCIVSPDLLCNIKELKQLVFYNEKYDLKQMMCLPESLESIYIKVKSISLKKPMFLPKSVKHLTLKHN